MCWKPWNQHDCVLRNYSYARRVFAKIINARVLTMLLLSLISKSLVKLSVAWTSVHTTHDVKWRCRVYLLQHANALTGHVVWTCKCRTEKGESHIRPWKRVNNPVVRLAVFRIQSDLFVLSSVMVLTLTQFGYLSGFGRSVVFHCLKRHFYTI